MKRFLLSIGSNIAPQKNIPKCIELLKSQFRLIALSSIYETAPVGSEGPRFWNLTAMIETPLDQENLLQTLKTIEKRLGRKRDPKNKFAPRTLDIDLLPQAGYLEQEFILIPLAEMAPNERDPESGKTFKELRAAFPEKSRNWKKISE